MHLFLIQPFFFFLVKVPFEFKSAPFLRQNLRSERAENVAITKQQEATIWLHYWLICISNIFFSSQKRWVHLPAGGELHNRDKRFLLTFPHPGLSEQKIVIIPNEFSRREKWCPGMQSPHLSCSVDATGLLAIWLPCRGGWRQKHQERTRTSGHAKPKEKSCFCLAPVVVLQTRWHQHTLIKFDITQTVRWKSLLSGRWRERRATVIIFQLRDAFDSLHTVTDGVSTSEY